MAPLQQAPDREGEEVSPPLPLPESSPKPWYAAIVQRVLEADAKTTARIAIVLSLAAIAGVEVSDLKGIALGFVQEAPKVEAPASPTPTP